MENEILTPQGDIALEPVKDSFHIVLVEPINSLNIGSVVRAMGNLGFQNLRLVAPRDWDPKKAAVTACNASDSVERIEIFETISEALAPMQEVVGLSTRSGKNRPKTALLAQWAKQAAVSAPKATALLFGPEETGLRQEHIEHCTWLIRIPSAKAYPSYNLAQAVLLVLFELSRHSWDGLSQSDMPQLPVWSEFYQLERIVEEVLQRSGFYRKGTPATMPGRVKNLLRRLEPDEREMEVLLGMFGRINRTLSGQSPIYPLDTKSEK